MMKEWIIWGWGFPKRAYTVMEIRTGFATGLPVLSSSLFAAYLAGHLQLGYAVLLFISGFCFNLVANIANEIRAFLKQEENTETFTGHLGSEGLVRGDATFLDAVLALLGCIGLGGGSGLLLIYFTKNWWLLALGIFCIILAVTYSLGPKPYIVYPVGEFVSGLSVGGISSLVASYLQLGQWNYFVFAYAWICMIMTVFLMSTNNTGDYEKDRGIRVTLPHIIGFRNSIKLIIPEFLTLLIAWLSLGIVLPMGVIIVGLVIFYYAGYVRWYKDYYKIEKVYPEMGKEFGPRPLIVINYFHYSMSLCFCFLLIMNGGR